MPVSVGTLVLPGEPGAFYPSLRESLVKVLERLRESGVVKGSRYFAVFDDFRLRNIGVFAVPVQMATGDLVVLLSKQTKYEEHYKSIVTLGATWRVYCKRFIRPVPGFEREFESLSGAAPVKAVLMDYAVVAGHVIPELRARIAELEREVEQERELADKALAAASNVRYVMSTLSKLSPEQIAEMSSNLNALMLRVEELKLIVEDGFNRVITELRRAKLRLEAGDIEGAKRSISAAEAVATSAAEAARGQLPSFAEDNPWLALLSKKGK